MNSREIQVGGDCLTYLTKILETRSAASDDHPKVLGLFAGMTSWTEKVEKRDVAELVIHGISTWMTPFCGNPQQISLLHGMDSSLSKPSGTLSQRLRFITSADKQRKGTGIQLMTLHSSKGLEFDNVWIVGVGRRKPTAHRLNRGGGKTLDVCRDDQGKESTDSQQRNGGRH